MEHVTSVGDRSGAYRILFGKHERRNYLENLGVNGRIILKCIFKTWDEGLELD
jgi:hypothetical protein